VSKEHFEVTEVLFKHYLRRDMSHHHTAYLGNIIEDRDVVNACAHAPAEGSPIYIIVDDVFQAWYQDRFKIVCLLAPVSASAMPYKDIPVQTPGGMIISTQPALRL
jgi:hypothetical protein